MNSQSLISRFQKIWLNPDNKPDEFEGMITHSEKVTKEVNESELLKTEGKEPELDSNAKISPPKSINHDQREPNKAKDYSSKYRKIE